MARSRIRENQIVDEDLLTEAEHVNWDHTTVSGVPTDFLDLFDTPSIYDDGKYLKSTSSGIVFDDGIVPSGTSITNFIDLEDTPDTYSGSADKFLQTTESGIIFSTASTTGVTDTIDVVTSISETTYTKVRMTFENGLLTTYSGLGDFDMPSTLLLE